METLLVLGLTALGIVLFVLWSRVGDLAARLKCAELDLNDLRRRLASGAAADTGGAAHAGAMGTAHPPATAPAPVLAAATVQGPDWVACPVCAMHIRRGYPRCWKCGAVMPPAPVVPAAANSEWACGNCGHQHNPASQTRCSGCNWPRWATEPAAPAPTPAPIVPAAGPQVPAAASPVPVEATPGPARPTPPPVPAVAPQFPRVAAARPPLAARPAAPPVPAGPGLLRRLLDRAGLVPAGGEGMTRATIEAWLEGRVLAIVGGMALLLGMVLLLSLAFTRGWINEPMRVGAGLVLGAGLMALGEMAFGRLKGILGLVLVAIGLAILEVSLYASTRLYDLIPVEIAVAGAFAAAVVAAVMAVRHDSQIVAALGLISVLAAPPVLGASPTLVTLLFLAATLVGTTIIALYRTWPWLPSLAFALRRRRWPSTSTARPLPAKRWSPSSGSGSSTWLRPVARRSVTRAIGCGRPR